MSYGSRYGGVFPSSFACVYSPMYLSVARAIYNFDGVDDRAVLATRAINPDGDIEIEFITPAVKVASGDRFIVSQGTNGAVTTWEFALFAVSNGNISLIFGGTVFPGVMSAAQYNPSEKIRMLITGTTCTFFRGAELIRTLTTARGAARQPAEPTVIGSWKSGASFSAYFAGLQYDIRINGTLWPMASRNQAIQPSIPAGNNMTLVNTTSDRWTELDPNAPLPALIFNNPQNSQYLPIL